MLPGIGACINGAAAGPVSNKRYWRLVMRQGGLVTTIVSEIEFRASPGGSDVTGSGTASASMENVGEEASRAFDNNDTTYWQANTTSSGLWIKYDLGAGNGQEIVEIALTPNAGFPERMVDIVDVQSSPDDSVWTTEWSVEQFTWTGGVQQVFTKPSAVAHRYWRLRADTLVSGNTMSCAEMELRASLGGADETGSGTASASTTFGGNPASLAFDNNASTLWSGNGGVDDNEWLAYDFGSGVTKAIAQVSFTARNDSFYTQSPTSGWIESSPDAHNWLPRKRFTGLSWSAGATNLIAV